MPQFFNSSTPVTSYVAYLSGIVAPSFQLSVTGAGAVTAKVKWHTEFGHLNRGDMLTSEQHRCSNEKKEISAQSLNANPLNWLLSTSL